MSLRQWPRLVLGGENDVREAGNSGFYVINAIIMAPPHHPVIAALTDSLLANKKAQAATLESWLFGPLFATGQVLMSATVTGEFTFLSNCYFEHLGMYFWPDRPSYEDFLRKNYQVQSGSKKIIASIHR